MRKLIEGVTELLTVGFLIGAISIMTSCGPAEVPDPLDEENATKIVVPELPAHAGYHEEFQKPFKAPELDSLPK